MSRTLPKKTHEIIERIATEHCHRVFGYLTAEDLHSEIWLICLKAIEEFKPARGHLEHFLRATVRNRLTNRFKDVTKSVRSPCPRCPYYDPGGSPRDCSAYGLEKDQCGKWHNYNLSVTSRNSLLNAVEPTKETSVSLNQLDQMAARETSLMILEHLKRDHPHLVVDFEHISSGGKLSKNREKKLFAVVRTYVQTSETE